MSNRQNPGDNYRNYILTTENLGLEQARVLTILKLIIKIKLLKIKITVLYKKQKAFLIASPLYKYINAQIGEIYMMMGKNGEARVRKNIVPKIKCVSYAQADISSKKRNLHFGNVQFLLTLGVAIYKLNEAAASDPRNTEVRRVRGTLFFLEGTVRIR